MNKTIFLGCWQLISFEITFDTIQKIYHPYGIQPTGYLMYLEEGFMSVHIMKKDRPICLSNDYTNLSPSEKMEIADNYGGYCGRYEIQKDKIIHYPEVSSFPHFIFTPQVRYYKMENNQLILTASYAVKDNRGMSYSKLV